MSKERKKGLAIMWLHTSLSAALWLAACAVAGIHDQTTTNAEGIRSIPVCLFHAEDIELC